ncbi:MAG: hypothetical protein ABI605_22460 [Rhizobacter sp.]
MSFPRQDLLRPSLTDQAQPPAAPYTLQTGFFTAFFGGPFAAALMLALNAKRIGRLNQDALWVALIACAFVVWLYFMYATPSGVAAQARLTDLLGERGPMLAQRLLALLAFAASAWLHRREQRSADLFALKRPNGWVAGIVFIVLGVLLTLGAIQALT